MNRLKTWWLLQGKSVIYIVYTIFLTLFFPYWVSLSYLPDFLKGAICLIGFGFAYRFFTLAQKVSNSIISRINLTESRQDNERVVDISSGTYNESVKNTSIKVEGDYVQGDKHINNTFKNFNFNQDATAAINEIQRTLTDLVKRFGDKEFAQQKVIDDLVRIIRQDNGLKKKMNEWLKLFGSVSSDDEIEIAEKIVNLANQDISEPFWKKYIEFAKHQDKYQRLTYLLRTSQWREGDEETVRIIKKLMPHPLKINNCKGIDVREITRQELQSINRIWLEASGGRFGFSVQKRIWIKINKLHSNQQSLSLYNIFAEPAYIIFAEAVGWSNDMGRIYHADFDYQITNPPGHLPAKILLLETYDPSSKYCTLSHCLFDEFMMRNYSELSFIPDLLRRWLLLD